MEKTEVRQTASQCVQLLKDVNYEQLGISQYNLEYIRHMLPDLEYYFRIYTDAILILLKKEKKAQGYLVDYGGGHGFLSILLKRLGFKVIYCDHNPLSVRAVSILSEKLDLNLDHIVEGTSHDLLAYCAVNKIKPSYLIATDLIEHVYDLRLFFADLYQINPAFQMVFTTGSNPSNPHKVRKLRRMMLEVETQYFLPMRQEYIQKYYSSLGNEDCELLAKHTRGMTYKDVDNEVDLFTKTGQLSIAQVDNYNTCDPQSGNWMERILSLKSYREILGKTGFRVDYKNGFYNEKRANYALSFTVKILNRLIKHSGHLGRFFSAYLILKVFPKR